MSDMYLVKNPLNPYEREHFKHDGPIIDFLQEVAPTGFGMPIRVFVNGDELELDDLDREVSDDDITAILVTPGFLDITLGMVIASLVSAAVSIVLSLLFAPKAPKYGEKDENPTYNINVLRNEARLGKPVPVVYGALWVTPDYAAKPYRFYTQGNWDQYLDVLMCIGCGEFEEIKPTDLKIGNTTLSDTSAVQIKQFQLGAPRGNILSHTGRFGEIQKELWREGWNGDAPVFVESMYTSPEVDGWLFTEDSTTSTVHDHIDITWNQVTSDTGATVYSITVKQHDLSTLLSAGARKLTVAGSALGNDGTYYLGYYNDLGHDPEVDIPIFTIGAAKTITPGADTINITTVKTDSNMTAGPYWTTPNIGMTTNYIYLDFVAEAGIYWVDSSGNFRVLGGAREIPYFKIDIFNSAGTKVMSTDFKMPGNGVSDPVRVTWPIAIETSPGVAAPLDRYKVSVTADYDVSTSTQVTNKVKLMAVKSQIRGYSGQPAYGDVTLLAVRMRATNGIASQSQNQLRVKAQRRFKLLNGTVGASANPADVAHDILTNQDYGASQSDKSTGTDVFIEWDSFRDCHKLWEGYKTDEANYPAFNASFATADTVWNALQSSLSVAVAKPVMHQGQVKIARDSIKPYRAFMFNSSNITLDSLTATYTLSPENEEDHVEIEYRDDDLMEPAYEIYPTAAILGSTPHSPFKVKLFGCTSQAYAEKYARLIYNRRLYQRKNVTFSTEMDGMLPIIGDRILVSSPQVRWGISGAVRFAKKNGSGQWVLTLDAIPDWTAIQAVGVTGWIVLTDKEGRVSTRVRVLATAAKDEHAVLNAEPTYFDGSPFEIDISGARDPARFAILLSSGENGRDMEITSIEHNGGTDFTIGAVHYEVRQDNSGHAMYTGVPAHMRKDYDGTDLI